MSRKIDLPPQAIADFADFMICAHGDFHTLHLKVEGKEFDVMHKEVLQEYYDEAAEDYDELAEWCEALDGELGSKNFAASRIKYPDYAPDAVTRDEAVTKSDWLLDQICKGFTLLFRACSDKCPIQLGFQDYIQGRLQYWAKEMAFFNKHRRFRGGKKK